MDPENRERPAKGAIRTMKTDADELLNKEKASFLDLFARQKGGGMGPAPIDSAPRVRFDPAPNPHNWASTLIVLVLGALLAGGGMFVYLTVQQNATPPEQTPAEPEYPRPILNTEQVKSITIRKNDRTGLLLEINEQKQAGFSEEDYLYLPVIISDFDVPSHIATPEEILATLRMAPPRDLYDSFSGRWNMYVNGSSIVFIFESKKRLETQGSMLRWEETMVSNFAQFVPGFEKGVFTFTDGITRNTDTRIARVSPADDAGVGYAMALGRYLVITTSVSALERTIERLIAQPIIE